MNVVFEDKYSLAGLGKLNLNLIVAVSFDAGGDKALQKRKMNNV